MNWTCCAIVPGLGNWEKGIWLPSSGQKGQLPLTNVFLIFNNVISKINNHIVVSNSYDFTSMLYLNGNCHIK